MRTFDQEVDRLVQRFGIPRSFAEERVREERSQDEDAEEDEEDADE